MVKFKINRTLRTDEIFNLAYRGEKCPIYFSDSL